MRTRHLALLLVGALAVPAAADDFFQIDRIEFLEKAPKNKKALGLYEYYAKEGKRGKESAFKPCLRVTLRSKAAIRTNLLFAKVYFYNQEYKLIAHQSAPSGIKRYGRLLLNPWPMVINRKKSEIFFEVPKHVRETPGWEALVVWGDEQGATAGQYPDKLLRSRLEFDEKELTERTAPVKRTPYEKTVVEHVVKTGMRKNSQITLLARPPSGKTDYKGVNGALALCVPAGSVKDVKNILINPDQANWAIQHSLDYADRHNLAVITWGSQGLWDASKNWDDHTAEEYKRMDERLDTMMAAWAKGIDELHETHGVPNKNFLLKGFSGSANFAARLALRQPRYFLAVHTHVAGSFDRPTPEGRDVLWCITSGELDGGYERSLRFVEACRKMGYPIIFKAGIGLGHRGSLQTNRLGRAFFDYALSLREEKAQLLAERNDPLSPRLKPDPASKVKPWPKDFQEPEFIADIVNQEVYPPEEKDLVPEPFRIYLPTETLANIWKDHH